MVSNVEVESAMPVKTKPLTPKEKLVLDHIETCIISSGISPSYQEIKQHFGFSSFNSVQNYLKQLKDKGYISWNQNQKRSLEILYSSESKKNELTKKASAQSKAPAQTPLSSEEVLNLPFYGKVAAGLPLERVETGETVQIPASYIRDAGKTFALRVEGESMIDEGILDGDLILVQSQSTAGNGDLVVATVDNESTVKRYFHRPYPYGEIKEMMVELRPSNPKMNSLWYSPDEVMIRGLVVGLLRQYR
jgi:repressor LexA